MRKLAIFFLAATLTCVAAKPVQAIFSVEPAMVCSNCENRIKTNLRFERGVKDIRTDLKTQTVTISYDSTRTDTVKLQEAFTKIGYNARVAGNK